MNRTQRRASERAGRASQRKPWSEFVEKTAFEIGEIGRQNPHFTGRIKRVWQNTQYFVFLVPEDKAFAHRVWDRVMVRRADAQPLCSWTDLYRIKNELFGEEVEAIQFLPKVSKLVDSANLYWFFVPNESYVDRTASVKELYDQALARQQSLQDEANALRDAICCMMVNDDTAAELKIDQANRLKDDRNGAPA